MDRVHIVETVLCWTNVVMENGVVIAYCDTTMYAETGVDQHIECPSCSGFAGMADGSEVALEEEWG